MTKAIAHTHLILPFFRSRLRLSKLSSSAACVAAVYGKCRSNLPCSFRGRAIGTVGAAGAVAAVKSIVSAPMARI